jgi:hypothetical protein
VGRWEREQERRRRWELRRQQQERERERVLALRRAAIGFRCGFCGVETGTACRTASGKTMRGPHAARFHAAEASADSVEAVAT